MRTAYRTATRALGIAVLAVVLSGCLKATQELTLHEDDTVDGTIVFAVNKQFLDMAQISADDFLKEITQGEGPVPGGVDFETAPYEDDEFIGSEFTFEGAPLSAFSDAGAGDISIVREGDVFVVSGTLDATSEDLDPSSVPGGEAIMDSFDVRISVTFPGEVETASGEIDGNTVTWTPTLGETTEISARGSAIASGGGGMDALPLILIGALVVLIVIVLVVVMARKKPAAGVEPVPEASVGATPESESGTAPAPETAAAPEATAPVRAAEPPPPPPVPVTEPVAERSAEPADAAGEADAGDADAGDGDADAGSD